jgi:hypothetical protein
MVPISLRELDDVSESTSSQCVRFHPKNQGAVRVDRGSRQVGRIFFRRSEIRALTRERDRAKIDSVSESLMQNKAADAGFQSSAHA